MKMKKTSVVKTTLQELLGVDPSLSDRDIANRLYLQTNYLVAELARHDIKPEEELCRHVPERDCSNCAGDLPWCWVVASGNVVDAEKGA